MSDPTASALRRFQTALEDWQRQVSGQTATVEQGLSLLRSREALQQSLSQSPTLGIHSLQKLHALDRQLLEQSAAISALIDLPAYRHSLASTTDAWWWYLDQRKPAHPQEKKDWAFKASRILLDAISLGLLADISRRVFLGGAGVAGVSAIALSSLLTLLTARSEFTLAGQQGLDQLFKAGRVPPHWREGARFGTAGLLFSGLLGFWLALPLLSQWYTQQGIAARRAGEWGSAQQDYQRAIALNPDNGEAHYSLGDLYEDLQQFEQAETAYRRAMAADIPQAYNNLGRLYLTADSPDPASAAGVLSRGIELVGRQERKLRADNAFFSTLYSVHKNLGWARFQQERDDEALRSLRLAIEVTQRPDAEAEAGEGLNAGAAYCLMAQVLERQADLEAALSAWQSCYQFGNRGNPDEDQWVFEACLRLRQADLPCQL